MRVRVVGDEGEVPLKLPGSIVLIYAVPIDAPSSRVRLNPRAFLVPGAAQHEDGGNWYYMPSSRAGSRR
jgi:hypothetical protein